MLDSKPSLEVHFPQFIQHDSPRQYTIFNHKCLHSFFVNGRIIHPLTMCRMCLLHFPYVGTLVRLLSALGFSSHHCCSQDPFLGPMRSFTHWAPDTYTGSFLHTHSGHNPLSCLAPLVIPWSVSYVPDF